MRIGRLIGTSLLVVAVLLAAGYGYVRSEAGMQWLAKQASELASSEDMAVVLSGLGGNVFSDVTLNSLSVADGQGAWLEVRGVRVVWRPLALLRGAATVLWLEAEQVALLREPQPGTQETGGEEVDVREVLAYLPQRLQVKELLVAEAVTGSAQRARLEGGREGSEYRVDVQGNEGAPLKLEARVQPQQEQFAVKLAFHEGEGGAVAALLGLPNRVELGLDADITTDAKGDVRIHAAQLRAGTLAADASGQYVAGQMDVALAVMAPDMDVISALAGMPMSGSANLKLTARGALEKLALGLVVEIPHVVAEEARFEQAQLRGEAVVNMRGALAAQGQLQAEGLYQDAPLKAALGGKILGDVLEISQLTAEHGNYQLSGTLRAEGAPALFKLHSDSTLRMAEGSAQLVLDGKIDSVKQHYEGNASGVLKHEAHVFDYAAKLDAGAEQVHVSELTLKGPGAQLTGWTKFLVKEQLAEGILDVQAEDLAPLGQASGQPLQGKLSGQVKLAHSGGRQGVDAQATASGLVVPGAQVKQASLKAKASDAKRFEGLDVAFDAAELTLPSLRAAKLRAAAQGGMENGLALSAEGEGTHEKKRWQANVRAALQQPQEAHYRVDISALSGHYDGAKLRMANKASLTHQPELTQLSPLDVEVAGGRIRAQGTLKAEAVKAAVSISRLSLHKLPVQGLPEAVLEGKLDIGGSAAKPVLDWRASTQATLEGMAVSVKAAGGWKGGTLSNRLDIRSDKAKAQLNTSLPATLSLQPFATDLGAQTPLKGKLEAGLPLNMFNAQLRPEGHRLGGQLSGGAQLAGTLGEPYFDGAFTLANGRYDHSPTGICLREMKAKLTGNKRAITLSELTATDNANHQMKAKAALALGGTPTISGDVRFGQFRLFCGGLMNGQLDGTLKASGTTQAAMLAGVLELGPLTIQIPGAKAGSEIPQVEAQWVKRGQSRAAEAHQSVVGLDIALKADKQLFVQGRGLDAEFAGKLAITGTSAAPVLAGRFDKKRGSFALLDRALTLNTATIKFEGPMPPSPFLEVAAGTKVNGNAITVSLAGSASKPKISLSSTPSLPQDELLALLLFGRNLERISPFEALQLAQATRVLAGLDGGGPGIVGNIRNALGLDRLEVGADQDSNVSVSTGKYVTEDVYVGVVQGAKPEDREVVTEFTVSPSVSGKTSVDSVGNQSVGVEWKRDY